MVYCDQKLQMNPLPCSSHGSLLHLFFLTTLGSCGEGSAAPAASSFTTGGHTVYHLRPATIDGSGKRVIISAAYDGEVLCHTPEGQLCWKAETGGGFPFDLCVADINGDGLDETLVASSDGAVYAFDPHGKTLWSFRKTPPLFQVCAAKQKDGKVHYPGRRSRAGALRPLAAGPLAADAADRALHPPPPRR